MSYYQTLTYKIDYNKLPKDGRFLGLSEDEIDLRLLTASESIILTFHRETSRGVDLNLAIENTTGLIDELFRLYDEEGMKFLLSVLYHYAALHYQDGKAIVMLILKSALGPVYQVPVWKQITIDDHKVSIADRLGPSRSFDEAMGWAYVSYFKAQFLVELHKEKKMAWAGLVDECMTRAREADNNIIVAYDHNHGTHIAQVLRYAYLHVFQQFRPNHPSPKYPDKKLELALQCGCTRDLVYGPGVSTLMAGQMSQWVEIRSRFMGPWQLEFIALWELQQGRIRVMITSNEAEDEDEDEELDGVPSSHVPKDGDQVVDESSTGSSTATPSTQSSVDMEAPMGEETSTLNGNVLVESTALSPAPAPVEVDSSVTNVIPESIGQEIVQSNTTYAREVSAIVIDDTSGEEAEIEVKKGANPMRSCWTSILSRLRGFVPFTFSAPKTEVEVDPLDAMEAQAAEKSTSTTTTSATPSPGRWTSFVATLSNIWGRVWPFRA